MNSSKTLAALILSAAVFPWGQAGAAAAPMPATADKAATLLATNLPAPTFPGAGIERQGGHAAATKIRPEPGSASAGEAPRARLAWPAFSLPAPEESPDWLLLVCAIAVIAFITHRKSALL